MTSKNIALDDRDDSNWRILTALFLVAFFTRIPLIQWYSAEYTDSILYITTFYSDHDFYLPLYGALISLLYGAMVFINEYETAARFISILSGSICTVPVFLTGRLIFNRRTGIYAALLYIFSPIAMRWDLRSMSDSLFTLLFMSSLYFIVRYYCGSSKRWLFLGVFVAGLAMLTRYQGLALAPVLALLLLREIREKRYAAVLTALPAIVPWLVFLWWVLIYRGSGHGRQYQESVAGIFAYLEAVAGYLFALPYALTYPVFALLCYGAYRAWKVERGRAFLLLSCALFVLWLVMHTAIRFLVVRYFMPLFPLAMILAAYGITSLKRERAVLVVLLSISIAASGAVLYLQRDSFGDIKRAAEWVRFNVRPQARLYASDIGGYKTIFWARRPVEVLSPETALRTGDYLVLNSFYVSISETEERLGEEFNFERLYETTSTVVPLLPDITNPAGYTNALGWKLVRFKKNEFKSVVVKIGEKK